MKRLLTIFGIILLAQGIRSAPANVEEPEADPQLRGIFQSLLSAFSTPILQGLATTGQKILSSAINGVPSTDDSLLESALGAINSVSGVTAEPLDIEQDEQLQNLQQDETLLNAFNAIIDQLLDQPSATESTEDEIPDDDVEEIPLYVVVV